MQRFIKSYIVLQKYGVDILISEKSLMTKGKEELFFSSQKKIILF